MLRWMAVLLLLCAGLGSHAVSAAQSSPGSLLWKLDVGGPMWSTPTHEGGMLYVGSDDGYLRAIDLSTHKVAWAFKTGDRVRSQPAVAGALVLLASDDGHLYAVDRQTGRERWRFDLKTQGLGRRLPSPDNPYYDYLQSSPVVHDGLVYVGSLNGELFAVDIATGQRKWGFGTSEAIRATPVIDGDTLYVASWDDHLYAFDLKTHHLLWRADTNGIVQSTPSIGAGRVVVGSRSAKLFAFDASDGAQAWHHVYGDGSWVESSARYADGLFFVGSSDSLKVSAFSAKDGTEVWQKPLGGWVWARPALANGTLYIGAISAFPHYAEGVTLKPGFFALDMRTGQERWRFAPGAVDGGFITGGVIAEPAIVDGAVYVAALDGSLYALKE